MRHKPQNHAVRGRVQKPSVGALVFSTIAGIAGVRMAARTRAYFASDAAMKCDSRGGRRRVPREKLSRLSYTRNGVLPAISHLVARLPC